MTTPNPSPVTLAELASLRSNCMKRRVGAVLISSTRKVVISTGYNGTPRGMPNCSDGGCQRCNSASRLSSKGSAPVRSGTEMEECLCLHAEENALLEAGRERAGAGEGGGTLYCNTCVCFPLWTSADVGRAAALACGARSRSSSAGCARSCTASPTRWTPTRPASLLRPASDCARLR
jgi:deoxycytidylate deaminase